MGHRQRFVVEGEWSGYTSAQCRVVHRKVETNFIDALKKIKAIGFTDGTSLSISVRPCKPREKVAELHGYTKLIDDAAFAVRQGRHPGGFMLVRDTDPPKRQGVHVHLAVGTAKT